MVTEVPGGFKVYTLVHTLELSDTHLSGCQSKMRVSHSFLHSFAQ